MKRLIAGVAALFLTAGAVGADPIFGTWKTAADDNGNSGLVVVAACGEKICGTLTKSFDVNGRNLPSEHVGKQLVWNMVNQGNGKYGKGKVFSPDRNKTYSGRMHLSGDSLKVQGCVFGICRDGGTWSRVN